MKYPRKWKNKESGQIVKVMPWWETLKNGEIDEVDEMGRLLKEETGVPCKFGVLTQIGYLLMNEYNEYGVWFGVSSSVTEHFEDMGEYVKGETNDNKEGD